MSYTYYGELWLVTRSDLEKLLEFEKYLQTRESPKDKEIALDRLLRMYIRYRDLVRRLVICYNQMVQTQKRNLIKSVLDCAIGRMLEYKREIVKMEATYYQWPDEVMVQLKLTPDDIAISAPAKAKERLEKHRRYIEEILEHQDKPPSIRERSLSMMMIDSMTDTDTIAESKMRLPRRRRIKRVLDDSIKSLFSLETPEEKEAREAREAVEKRMHDAVVLIQSHERARAARRIATHVKSVYDYKRKLKTGETEAQQFDSTTLLNAVLKIQRAWRRIAAKKAMRRRWDRTEEKLGMTIPSWENREVFEKDKKNFNRNIRAMEVYEAKTNKAIEEEWTRLLEIRGPGLIEDITDEIHEWFVVWYDTVGHFDAYPAASLGGSVLIATGQTLDPQEYLIQQIAKAKAAKNKDKKKVKVKMEMPTRRQHRRLIPETRALVCLAKANNEFIENWSYRDDSEKLKPCMDLITDQLCYELQLEMRSVVDELMRLELAKLNEALLKDHAGDRPKFTIPKMPLAVEKSKKKKRGKKKRADPLDDVPIASLFEELVRTGIIKTYPEVSLDEWQGDISYRNYEAKQEFREHSHHLGDIKQVVMEYCVLPLSSKETHQVTPLTRSICICGLSLSGKSFLANAICTEVGALMFDLTPSVLVNKYMGKKNQVRLMKVISKVSRVYAPSIIFIDGGERPWLKKVPIEDRWIQPKRFARYYARFVKNIKPGDQILFMTVSSEPYRAKKAFMKIHDKFIIIPLTDYNTLYMYYKDLLMKYHGVDRNMDISCLAKFSIGVPLHFIRQAIEDTLPLKRRIVLNVKPLKPEEIMEKIFQYEPPSARTLRNFRKFVNKIPLEKKRKKIVELGKKHHEKMMKLKIAQEKKRQK